MAKAPKKTEDKSNANDENGGGNGTTTAAETKKVDIGDISVPLPNRFLSELGRPMTMADIKIKFEHVSGQFRNNQVANAKARAKRYSEAKTDSERDENKPLTVDQLLTIWETYSPQIGGGPRLGSMERMRLDAAWRAWTETVTAHNASEKAGNGPVISKAAGNANVQTFTFRHVEGEGDSAKVSVYHARPRKGKDMSEDQHKSLVEAYDETLEAFKRKLLDTPWLADSIQKHLDAIMAEKGAKDEATTAAAQEATDSLL